jgi:hypothetical protein
MISKENSLDAEGGMKMRAQQSLNLIVGPL